MSLSNNNNEVSIIERIVGEHIIEGKHYYRVRWEGFTEEDDTYELDANFAPILIYEYHQSQQQQQSVASTVPIVTNNTVDPSISSSIGSIPLIDTDTLQFQQRLERERFTFEQEKIKFEEEKRRFFAKQAIPQQISSLETKTVTVPLPVTKHESNDSSNSSSTSGLLIDSRKRKMIDISTTTNTTSELSSKDSNTPKTNDEIHSKIPRTIPHTSHSSINNNDNTPNDIDANIKTNNIDELQQQLVTQLDELLLSSTTVTPTNVMISIQHLTHLLNTNDTTSTSSLIATTITIWSQRAAFLSSLPKCPPIALSLVSSNEWLILMCKWLSSLILSQPCPDQHTVHGHALEIILKLLDWLPLPYPVRQPSEGCMKLNYIINDLQNYYKGQWVHQLVTGMYIFFFSVCIVDFLVY